MVIICIYFFFQIFVCNFRVIPVAALHTTNASKNCLKNCSRKYNLAIGLPFSHSIAA